MDSLSSTVGIVALAACAVALAALVFCIVLALRLRRLRASQRVLMGESERDLIAHSAELTTGFEALHHYVEDVAQRLIGRLGTAEQRLDGAIAYRGLVRFDAYNELSGRQSTSIALLDASRSGIVLSSIAHRDQARIYAKQVVDGRGDVQLAPEEEEAVRRALAGEGPAVPTADAAPADQDPRLMRVGYLGPEGTFSEEALWATAPRGVDAVGFPTIHDVTEAVANGDVERGLVPIENSLEGSVNTTLDALTAPGSRLAIVGETVLAITQCLIARPGVAIEAVEAVLSHPQALAQCAGFLRAELPGARLVAAGSTAEAANTVVDGVDPWAAIGPRRAARVSGGVILREGIQDEEGNETRFVWLCTDPSAAPFGPADGPHRTSIVFAGEGDEAPGWLVRCLTELSSRAVNLTKIESRPRRRRLGHYLFLVDLEGRTGDTTIDGAIDGLRAHCQELRVLGSYPAALARSVH